MKVGRTFLRWKIDVGGSFVCGECGGWILVGSGLGFAFEIWVRLWGVGKDDGCVFTDYF